MDNTLKQRLIGATVLVALAVIFLPMLVKGPPTTGGADDVPLGAPVAPADGQFQTRELPLVVPAGANGGSATGLQGPAVVSAGASTTAPADAADAADPAIAAAGDYAVNYGAYASQTDAQTIISALGAAGFTAFSEPARVNGQSAWRVRIGPYADRAAAEAVRLRAAALRSDVIPQVVVLDGASAATPPAPVAVAPAATPRSEPATPASAAAVAAKPAAPTPAPARTPAPAPAPKPAVVAAPKPTPAPAPARPAASAAASLGWVVQLGAFSNAAEATALRERVRGAGFSAFVEQVPTDNGILNRVRVGPVASREAAEQLKAQLAARTGASGMVRQHP